MASHTIRDLIAQLRGTAQTPRINRDATQATAVSAVILKNDPSRVFWLVVNLGAFDCFLAPDGVASPTRGVRLASNGGAATAQWDEDGEVTAHEWQAVGNGGTTALFILENLIEGPAKEATP